MLEAYSRDCGPRGASQANMGPGLTAFAAWRRWGLGPGTPAHVQCSFQCMFSPLREIKVWLSLLLASMTFSQNEVPGPQGGACPAADYGSRGAGGFGGATRYCLGGDLASHSIPLSYLRPDTPSL